MYLPPVFTENDAAFVTRFVDEHPLATVIVHTRDDIQVDHLPVLRTSPLVSGGRLIAHVAKSNSLWKSLQNGASAVLVFSGAGAYISPSLYPSKAKTHEVVPTWNYIAVHLHGRLSCTHDDAEKRAIVEALTTKMEARRREPWKVSDAPAPYIDKMLSELVGLTFEISTIIAKRKASQNRTAEDRQGVIAGLSAQPGSEEAASAAARESAR